MNGASRASQVHDVIVIGSGIGGLGCAAALAHFGRRVLVLERHYVAGGLTHAFSREGYTWDVGVHYLGQMGPGQPMRRLLAWLTNDAIDFASMGAVYDIVRLADGYRFEFARPRQALESSLHEAFPRAAEDIARFFSVLEEIRRDATVPFQMRAMPPWLARVVGWLKRRAIARWWGRTTDQVLREIVKDPLLRAVLSAQWGDHGGRPSVASFAMHAVILQHYLDGAWYPLGGAPAFAKTLVPAIERAGGEVRTSSAVARVVIDNGRATGVELEDGSRQRASLIVSDIGAQNTLLKLLPTQWRDTAWARELMSLEPSVCNIGLYLGFEGDIESAGATRANHWIYETNRIDAVWDDPFNQRRAPSIFVSFPSLKDPGHVSGGTRRHTGEIVVWTDWAVFEPWIDSTRGGRPEDYTALKQGLERALLEQFAEHFPGLAPMVKYHELSTPLSTAHFTGRHRGAIYGLNTTPRRFLSRSLDVRTPIPGLLLAGQDVVTPGVAGALMGGILAAAVIEPRVFAKLPRQAA